MTPLFAGCAPGSDCPVRDWSSAGDVLLVGGVLAAVAVWLYFRWRMRATDPTQPPPRLVRAAERVGAWWDRVPGPSKDPDRYRRPPRDGRPRESADPAATDAFGNPREPPGQGT